MKRIALVIYTVLHVLHSYAQETEIKRLHIGDTMPPITFTMLNYKDSTLNIGNLHHKLIILSFWTPACTFSSAQLPVLYMLQQQFPNDLCIVPVGFDGGEEGAARQYVKASKGTAKEVRIATAIQPYNDNSLYQKLPFMGLPHNIWLDSQHVIRAITDHFPLRPDNIAAAIEGKQLTLDLKDFDPGFDEQKPLLIDGNGGADSAFSYRSLITPYKPYISLGLVQERTATYTRVAEGNATPTMLLQTAVTGSDAAQRVPLYDPMFKRLMNLVAGNELFDTAWYDLPFSEYAKAEALRKKQVFCYEALLPPRFNYREAYHKMLADLCDYFRVTAGIERQPVKTFVIVKKGNVKEDPSAGGDEQISVSEDCLSFSFKHCNISRIAEVLNYVVKMPLIANGTKLQGKLSLSFRLAATDDLAGLEQAFSTIGLQLNEKTVATDMIVIRNR